MGPPDNDVRLDRSAGPDAFQRLGHFTCVVVPVARYNGDIMSGSRPEPRQLIESRAARLARVQIVLVDDEDFQSMSTFSNRPFDNLNLARIASVDTSQQSESTDSE